MKILNTPMQKFLKNYPKRGEVYIADLNPGFAKEIHKKRPVLIISKDEVNKNSPYAIVIPASSIVPQTLNKEMVLLNNRSGLNKKSVLLTIFIRSIDKERLIKKIGKLSKSKLEEVEESLKLVLGMVELDWRNI